LKNTTVSSLSQKLSRKLILNFSRIAVAKTKESVIDLFTSAKNYTKLVLKNSYTQQQQHTTDYHINYYQNLVFVKLLG